jgi:hypothetical protein
VLAALLVAKDPAPISGAPPVCAGQLNLLAALARPDAKVRDQESEATRHTGARPDRDAAMMRHFLHWPCRTLSWPRPHVILLSLHRPIGNVRGALHLHSVWTENCRRSLKSCCLFSNRNCAPPSETGADDAAFPSLVASYCRPAQFSKSELLGS